MKLNFSRIKHKPLKTFREMLDEFGVSRGVLTYALRDQDSPKPKFIYATNGSPRNTWYDPIEMRKWWELRKAAKAAQ